MPNVTSHYKNSYSTNPTLKSIQTGTASPASGSPAIINVSSVNTSKSELLLTSYTNGGTFTGALGAITSPTQITISTSSTTATVAWSLKEYF